MWDSFVQGFGLALSLSTFLMMAIGLLLGMFVGALPGFSTIMAMAIVLPLSFFLDPLVGIPFLIGVYKGGIFGGSIPAILVSIPGTGAAVATTFDGPALTKKNQSRKAMEMALYSSVFGDLTSDIITILAIGPIALIAMRIGPPELSAILFISLIFITATTSGVFIKGLIMLTVGMFLAAIGTDPLGGMSRFTFDIFELKSGIPLLPMLMGVYAIPEILLAIEQKGKDINRDNIISVGERLKFHEFRRCFRTIVRSTGIGAAIGMIPGVGQVVAAFMGYAAAKNASSHPETFGKGELEGVAAAEAANNAVNGPTLVPLMTLGIPGDNVTAILLGAFVAQGLRPGPQLFNDQGHLVFAILIAMVFANILFLIIGFFAVPLFAKIVTIRRSLLLPSTLVLAFAGSYVFRSDPNDLIILVCFGAFGYISRKLQFDVTPMVMGFILGPILEYSFGQTLSMSKGNLLGFIMFDRPITALILVTVPVFTFWIWSRANRIRKEFS
jgi:putative tricarboxylic transport membrane protein